MKKILTFVFLFALIGVFTAQADNDRPISIAQLPQKAQQFIKQHFPNEKAVYAKNERDFLESRYEVVFSNSIKVEFMKNGEWKEVDCKYNTVPTAIIPPQITQYVTNNYPETKIVGIDRDRRNYEIKLSNGLSLTFDLKFNLIEIDD